MDRACLNQFCCARARFADPFVVRNLAVVRGLAKRFVYYSPRYLSLRRIASVSRTRDESATDIKWNFLLQKKTN